MINKSGVLRKFKLKSNFLIATFVATLNMGLQRRLRSVKIVKTQVIIRLLRILYQNGIIRSYAIKNDVILVYFKYSNSNQICANFSIVSKPSKRARWGLNQLAKTYNTHSFTGFYIVSTKKGFVTADRCLLHGHSGGEIIIKVELN